jgi:RHS repeat-associated protein
LQQVADAAGSGRFLNVFWGADGRISAIQDSAGRQVLYAYSSQGALTSANDPAGRVTSYGYTQGRFAPLLSTVTDNWNRLLTTVTYDSADRVTSYVDQGETWTYAYNYTAGVYYGTTKTDSAGNSWQYTYLSSGLITDRVAPGNSPRWHTDFNADGSVQQINDPVGVNTVYTYDTAGNVSSVGTYATWTTTGNLRRDYTYDPNFSGRVTSVTPRDPATGLVNPDWPAWRYDYYQAGDPAPGALHHVYRVESDGATLDTLETYTYDAQGRMLTETNAEGAVTTYVYDSAGDLASVTLPATNDSGVLPTTTYAYDAAGRVTKETDALGNQTLYSYDAIGRILTMTLPQPAQGSSLNFTTTYAYDSFDATTGLLFASATDPNGNVTRRGDDAYGRAVRSIDALGATTINGFTADLLTSVSDANGNVTAYSYDRLKRLTATKFPDGSQETYTWGDDNLLAGVMDRRQQFTTRDYDRFKRLDEKTFQSPFTYPTMESIDYTYQGQKLVSVTDPTASTTETHTYTYDSSYRMIADTQATRGTVNYTYTKADRIASMAVSGGPTTSYTYYPDGGLDTIQWSLVSGQFKYSYDLRGLYQTITFPNGQHRDFTYDNQGRLLRIANLHPSAGNLATFGYGYDLDSTTGQPTVLGEKTTLTADVPSQSFSGAVTKYAYDRSYQLVQAQYPSAAPFSGEIDAWTYDGIGNRLTSTVNGATQTYSYQQIGANPNNWQRLLSDGVNTYTYDGNGNTTAQTGPGGAWTFDSSPRDELRTIHLGGSAYAIYYYDYQGRRTGKGVAVGTTTYLYDGLNLIGETGASTAWYLYGPGIDQPIALSKAGSLSYLNVDGLGSVVEANDAAGNVQHSVVFDVWGNTRGESGTRFQPFTYTAREVGEGSLLFYRSRYYNLGPSRFLEEDRDAVGGRSFYAYVDNEPVAGIDPLGRYTIRLNKTLHPVRDPQPNCGSHFACTRAGVALACACSCGQDKRYHTDPLLIVTADIYYTTLPFKQIKSRPVDPNVVDSKSAIAHELSVHINPAIDAVRGDLQALTDQAFDSASQCQGECGRR